MKRVALLIVLLTGVYVWYQWVWAPREEEKPNPVVKEQPESMESTKDQPEEDAQKEQSKKSKPSALNIPQPRIKDVTGKEGLNPPKEVIENAGRFHWLVHLSGPSIETEAVVAEIDKISRPEIAEALRKSDFEVHPKKQVWGVILVGAFEKDGDVWKVNTVAEVDNQTTMLNLQLKKGGDGKWKVWHLSKDPS